MTIVLTVIVKASKSSTAFSAFLICSFNIFSSTVSCNVTSGQADELLEKLHATIKQYQPSNMPDAISYAYGYSYSMNYKDCTLRNLLDKADHEMYLNKQAQKKKR